MKKHSWASLLLLAAQGLQAHCGLNFCPRDEDVAGNRFTAGLALRQTGFDLADHGGQYTEVMPDFQYTRNGKLLLGANLAIAGLMVEGETRWGLENPLLYGEWRCFPGTDNRLSLGLQLELPFGDEEKGIGTDHTMLVPYVSFGKGFDPFFASATLGYNQAFGGGEEDTADPAVLYVHPHEDREFLYRVSAGISVWDKRANPEIYLNGQHPLVDEKENLPEDEDDDLSLGLSVPVRLGNIAVTPKAEFPLLSPSRFDWGAGVDFGYGF
jgi:hypothetical protein